MFLFILLLSVYTVFCKENLPGQVHLSYNGNPTEMVVTWITMDKYDKDSTVAYVKYSEDEKNLNVLQYGTTTKWTDGGELQIKRYTNRAIMKNLIPGKKYYYSVGSVEAESTTFTFVALNPESKEIRAAIFGDFSKKGGEALDSLINYAQSGKIDIVFHIGDISYDLDKKNGEHGDTYMKMIEPFAAYVPYMVVAGNHDQGQNFLHYKMRFTMPQNGVYGDNQFWSFDFGDYHFVGTSTEYYGLEMKEEVNKQYDWLINDLKMKEKNAWTIHMQHRPMYCSNKKKHHCQDDEFIMTRSGLNGMPGLEKPFNDYGVDMSFWSHRHTYERFYPLYQNLTFTQRDTQHFHNSPTPVYHLTGSAGCDNHEDQSAIIGAPYSAARLGNYGFSVLHIHNSTTLSTYFVPSDNPSTPLDVFTLTKDPGHKPGPHS